LHLLILGTGLTYIENTMLTKPVGKPPPYWYANVSRCPCRKLPWASRSKRPDRTYSGLASKAI